MSFVCLFVSVFVPSRPLLAAVFRNSLHVHLLSFYFLVITCFRSLPLKSS